MAIWKVETGCAAEVSAAKKVLLALGDYESAYVERIHNRLIEGTRGRVLRVLAVNQSSWHGLKLILEALARCDADDSPQYIGELKQWVRRKNRGYWFVKPDKRLLEEVISLSEKIKMNDADFGCVVKANGIIKYVHGLDV